MFSFLPINMTLNGWTFDKSPVWSRKHIIHIRLVSYIQCFSMIISDYINIPKSINSIPIQWVAYYAIVSHCGYPLWLPLWYHLGGFDHAAVGMAWSSESSRRCSISLTRREGNRFGEAKADEAVDRRIYIYNTYNLYYYSIWYNDNIDI